VQNTHADTAITVGVMLGRYPLIARGIASVLREVDKLTVIEKDNDGSTTVQVMIVDEGTLSSVVPREDCRLVVVARDAPLPFGMLLVAAGVSCLELSASERSVVDAVVLAAEDGCMFVCGRGRLIGRRDGSEGPLLTSREIEVLKQAVAGVGFSEIASGLQISARTVQKHVESLKDKLNAVSVRDLRGLPVEWLTK